jgi:hypothetical protein
VQAQAALPMPSSAWVLFWITLCVSIVAVRQGCFFFALTFRL